MTFCCCCTNWNSIVGGFKLKQPLRPEAQQDTHAFHLKSVLKVQEGPSNRRIMPPAIALAKESFMFSPNKRENNNKNLRAVYAKKDNCHKSSLNFFSLPPLWPASLSYSFVNNCNRIFMLRVGGEIKNIF